jgi:putative FmdB family regulatory protein
VEKIQKFSDPPLEICPKCGGSLERLLSSPAIQFKGSGWYVTDYARKSSATATADSPAAKAETSTETKKPAEPASSKPSTDSK